MRNKKKINNIQKRRQSISFVPVKGKLKRETVLYSDLPFMPVTFRDMSKEFPSLGAFESFSGHQGIHITPDKLYLIDEITDKLIKIFTGVFDNAVKVSQDLGKKDTVSFFEGIGLCSYYWTADKKLGFSLQSAVRRLFSRTISNIIDEYDNETHYKFLIPIHDALESCYQQFHDIVGYSNIQKSYILQEIDEDCRYKLKHLRESIAEYKLDVNISEDIAEVKYLFDKKNR